MRGDTEEMSRYRCYGADIGVAASPDQLVAMAAMPMTPVTGHIRTSIDGVVSAQPLVVYTTTTPGVVLHQVADITRTTITQNAENPQPQVSYDSTWQVAHHSLAISGGGLGGFTYPAALDIARNLATVSVDWTASHQDLYRIIYTDPLRQQIVDQRDRAKQPFGSADFLELVADTFALNRPCFGDGLSMALFDLIDQILTWGWTPTTLADRLTYNLRCGDTHRARHRAFQRRLRLIPPPADVGIRPVWCLECDPGTRLVKDSRGWLIACPNCHTRRPLTNGHDITH